MRDFLYGALIGISFVIFLEYHVPIMTLPLAFIVTIIASIDNDRKI